MNMDRLRSFSGSREADVVEVGDCALNETASSYLFSIPVTGLSNASFAWMKNAVPYQGDNFILSVAKTALLMEICFR